MTDVAVPLIVAVLALAGVAWQLHRQRRVEFEIARRQRLAPDYEALHRSFVSLVRESRGGAPDAAAVQRIEAMHDQVTGSLLIWGHTDVLRAWDDWKQYARAYSASGGKGDPDGSGAVQHWGKMFLAMRQDMGHSNKGLTADDLLRLYITDWKLEE